MPLIPDPRDAARPRGQILDRGQRPGDAVPREHADRAGAAGHVEACPVRRDRDDARAEHAPRATGGRGQLPGARVARERLDDRVVGGRDVDEIAVGRDDDVADTREGGPVDPVTLGLDVAELAGRSRRARARRARHRPRRSRRGACGPAMRRSPAGGSSRTRRPGSRSAARALLSAPVPVASESTSRVLVGAIPPTSTWAESGVTERSPPLVRPSLSPTNVSSPVESSREKTTTESSKLRRRARTCRPGRS